MHVEAELNLFLRDVLDGGKLFAVPDAVKKTLGGDWKWGWLDVGREGQMHRIGLKWTGVHDPPVIRDGRLEFVDGAKALWAMDFGEEAFPPAPSGSFRSKPIQVSSSMKVSLRLELAVAQAKDEPTVVKDPGNAALVSRFALLTTQQTPYNVLFRFPRGGGREIWSSEALLASRSSYFASLFSSDFGEASGLASSSHRDPLTLPFEDSDGEADADLPAPSSRTRTAAKSPHKTVTVTEAAYTTYLAVICYLQCETIVFAPLSSSRPFLPARSDTPSSSSPSPSPFPPAASPKSVYRLSHILELPALSALALSNFRTQLTPSNALTELFDDLCWEYDEPREAVLDYIAANRAQVAESDEMRRRMAQVEEDEMDEDEAATWPRLAKRLMVAK